MSNAKLLIAEISYRKLNFALCLLAVAVAATLLVAGPTILNGYGQETEQLTAQQQEKTETALDEFRDETKTELERQEREGAAKIAALDKKTKRIMRDLGFNLRIVHKDTDTTNLITGFVAKDMPEEYVQRLANSPALTKVVHLVAKLNAMIKWDGRKRLIAGFAPEATQTHLEKKPAMGLQIKQGDVVLGYETAIGSGTEKAPQYKVGSEAMILGKTFKVTMVIRELGNERDVMIAMHLKDAQEILDKRGKITEILALGCKCETVERLAEIREQLEKVLPETRITEFTGIAVARAEQRNVVKKYQQEALKGYAAEREKTLTREEEDHEAILSDLEDTRGKQQHMIGNLVWISTPLVTLAAVAFIALMTWTNVRERRTEIGLLRALGRATQHIAVLFLGKAALLGLIGGALGCLAGYALAYGVGPLMQISSESIAVSTPLLAATLLGAPLIAAMAAYLPTRTAIAQDPAVVLMEQ
jgi:hypothetical protein